MSKELRDACLLLGTMGIIVAWAIVLVAVLSGVKLIKVIVLSGAILAASTCLFYLGLSPYIQRRIKRQVQSLRL